LAETTPNGSHIASTGQWVAERSLERTRLSFIENRSRLCCFATIGISSLANHRLLMEYDTGGCSHKAVIGRCKGCTASIRIISSEDWWLSRRSVAPRVIRVGKVIAGTDSSFGDYAVVRAERVWRLSKVGTPAHLAKLSLTCDWWLKSLV